MHIRPIKTQKISDNVFAIRTVISNFYIYTDGESTLCFDTGYLPPLIGVALKRLNIKAESVSHIFLTHSDFDHTGGISVFKQAKVFLSKEEEPMITFKRPRLLFIFNRRIRKEYSLLKDGDVINVGKIRVKAITTPGHTLGSMSYLVNDHALFTGDTLTVKGNTIKPFFWLQNMNTKKQKDSIKKLSAITSVDLIATGHSGVLLKNKTDY